jgi:hypothetical protein
MPFSGFCCWCPDPILSSSTLLNPLAASWVWSLTCGEIDAASCNRVCLFDDFFCGGHASCCYWVLTIFIVQKPFAKLCHVWQNSMSHVFTLEDTPFGGNFIAITSSFRFLLTHHISPRLASGITLLLFPKSWTKARNTNSVSERQMSDVGCELTKTRSQS